MDFLEK